MAEFDRAATVAAITGASAAQGRWIVDNDPSPRYPIFTRANIGEVFPDVVMPFSWTLWGIPHTETGWRQAFINLGAFDADEFTPNAMEVLSVFGGYGYLNVSASRIFGARTPGLSAEAIDQSFFGEQPDVPPYVAAPTDASAKHSEKLGAMLGWVFSQTSLSDLLETRTRMQALRAARPDFGALSDGALLEHVISLCGEHFEPLWVRHIMATYHSMIPSGVIGGVCAAVGKPELAADILGAAGDVDSALPAKALWALSRVVRADPALSHAFDGGHEGVLERCGTQFRESFNGFLRDYGFRGPKEWEMRSRCWELDPATPLAAIDQMRRAGDHESPEARMATRLTARAAAIATVEADLAADPATLGQFQAAVRAAGLFFAGRERTKTHCAMLVHEMRMAMDALGRRFVSRGLFDSADQFALLTVDEWRAAIAAPETVRSILAVRTAEEAKLSALEPPFIVNGVVPPISSWKPRTAQRQQVGVGAVLTGQPGCAGIARGIARIIDDPSDPGDMEPGDVLIARHTDPSWTPLFSAAGTVVVNVGATVSHAVIVARELGVPCAVSVTGATDSIPHGATVEVDGGKGTVTVLALP